MGRIITVLTDWHTTIVAAFTKLDYVFYRKGTQSAVYWHPKEDKAETHYLFDAPLPHHFQDIDDKRKCKKIADYIRAYITAQTWFRTPPLRINDKPILWAWVPEQSKLGAAMYAVCEEKDGKSLWYCTEATTWQRGNYRDGAMEVIANLLDGLHLSNIAAPIFKP
jgi:hypothetical protein